jgi:hypothetical protein
MSCAVGTPAPCPEVQLHADRAHRRQYLCDVILSCISSEFLGDVRPSGSPPTGAGGPAYITLTELFGPNRDVMGNANDRSAPFGRNLLPMAGQVRRHVKFTCDYGEKSALGQRVAALRQGRKPGLIAGF